MREQQPRLGFQTSGDRQDQGPSSAGAEEKQTSEAIIPNGATSVLAAVHGARGNPSADAALRSRSSKQTNDGCPIHNAEQR